MGRAHNTHSAIGNTLEKLGLVARRKGRSRDGREVELSLTPEGQACLDAYQREMRHLLAPIQKLTAYLLGRSRTERDNILLAR